jgi:hypothetical protein
MEPISGLPWWRGYLIGRWLLALGLVDLIFAGIFFTLPGNIFSNGRVWFIALCPSAIAAVIALARKGT